MISSSEPSADVLANGVDVVAPPEAERTAEAPRSRPRNRRQRITTSLASTTLFFAGAAFSAGAGDILVEAVEADCEAAEAQMTADAAAECEAETAEEADETATADGSAEGPTRDDGEPAAADTKTETRETGEGAGTEPSDTDDAGGDATAEEPASDDGEPADTGTERVTGETGERAGTERSDVDGADGDAAEERDGDADTPVTGGGNGGSGETRNEPAGDPILVLDDEHGAEHDHELDPEPSTSGSVATIWLHRTLPDPTPVARRLAPGFVKQLAAVSTRTGVEWAVLLAAVRARGHMSRWPADPAELRATARQLRSTLRASGEWQAFLALMGRTAYADRAAALMHYNRAVGLRALITGLEAAKPKLERTVLADRRLDIYAGGRADIEAGRIDVRVLVLMRYLAERYEQVTVSSLVTGHGVYARPGVVSAHTYGLAVDIPVLGGQTILRNSAPGGVTEQAVRDILLLPAELRPKQVISLVGLGGASFPLEDHADHIHVGY